MPLNFIDTHNYLSYGLNMLRYQKIKDDINSIFTSGNDDILKRLKSFDMDAKIEAFPKVRSIVLQECGGDHNDDEIAKLTTEFLEDVLMMSVITNLYHRGLKNEITDLFICGFDDVYYSNLEGTYIDTDIRFKDNNHLYEFISKHVDIINSKFNQTNLILEADNVGQRLSGLHELISAGGFEFSFRFPRKEIFTFNEMVSIGTISTEMKNFYAALLHTNESSIVFGKTGSGKTTTINTMICSYPRDKNGRSCDRHALIADRLESSLKIKDPKLRLVEVFERHTGDSTIDVQQLLRAVLRHNVKFIHFNEIRSNEFRTLLEAWASGHSGISGTHGENFGGAIKRMKLILTNANLGEKQAETLLSTVCHVYIRCSQLNKKRIHSKIYLLHGFKNGEPYYDTLAEYLPKEDKFIFYYDKISTRLKNSFAKANIEFGGVN